MSVEKQARRALRRATFYRLVGELVEVPFELVKALSGFFRVVGSLGEKITWPLFYLELDAAREYRLLTGVDLGVATGNPDRYMGTRPEAFEAAVAEYADDEDGDE